MVRKQPKKTWRERLNISRWAIALPRVTICFWLVVVVAGLLAFSSLKYALFPDITFPVVVVNATAPIATAERTETELTYPIEAPLQSITGIDEIVSSTYPGQTAIRLLFFPQTSLEEATDKVKQAVSKVNLSPEASLEVIPFNLNESTTITYAIKSETKSLRELNKIAVEQIIPSLGQVEGVLKVNLLGDDNITPDPINPELSNFPSLVRFNGENALGIAVIKRSEANTLEVVRQVEKTISKIKSQLPEVDLIVAKTQADYIREATQSTIEALLGAIILAILVIFPFLRTWQATLITALAIPISLLGTFIVMAICGFQLETITLLALALVIGIIVDDAIVDVENIARHIEEGTPPKQAAIIATDEIGFTVSASTLTIVAVFLPVAFMGGTIGQFFKPFGVTVSAAVITSLLVARTLSPVLAVYWLKPQPRKVNQANNKPPQDILHRQYANLLNWSLHHRYLVVAMAILSFVAGIALIPLIPQGFIPKLDRGEFNIVYTSPLPKAKFSSGTAPQQPASSQEDNLNWLNISPEKILLRKTRSVGEELEAEVLKYPWVDSILTTAGLEGNPTKGSIYVKLKDNSQISTFAAQEQIRQSLPVIKGVNTSVEDISFIDLGSESNFQITIYGDDIKTLRKTAEAIQDKVAKLPGFVDVSLSGNVNEEGEFLEIEHRNFERAIFLNANLNEEISLGDATEKVIDIAEPILPAGVSLNRSGNSAHSAHVLESFGVTLTFSVLCMLAVLILPFGRLLEPLVVGLSLPLSIVGAMLALLITRSEFGMISVIGMIFLLGLLDKNAVLLMDYANQLRLAGKNRTEAILETGSVRLRPILMTTASTILGMMPLALGLGAGAELRQPMAVAIIGGLLTSSLLSLIVVPVLYTLLEGERGKGKGERRE